MFHVVRTGGAVTTAGDAPPLRPVIGLIVMVDIGEQNARGCLVHDDTQIAVHADRPEVLVFGLLDAVEMKPGRNRTHLKVHRRNLDGLLLLRR